MVGREQRREEKVSPRGTSDGGVCAAEGEKGEGIDRCLQEGGVKGVGREPV